MGDNLIVLFAISAPQQAIFLDYGSAHVKLLHGELCPGEIAHQRSKRTGRLPGTLEVNEKQQLSEELVEMRCSQQKSISLKIGKLQEQ